MWQDNQQSLFKQFDFNSFHEACNFITKVASIAEEQHCYPKWENDNKVVKIWLDTDKYGRICKTTAKAIDDLVKAKSSETDKPGHETILKLYADGGSRGNPGPSASGYVLFSQNDDVLLDKGVYLGVTTNNQAEYTALKLGLEAAQERQAQEVDVYMDSLLVINQMKGIFKVRNRDLWPIHAAIQDLIKQFRKVSFTHVPRELNKAADAAVNRALDAALSKGSSENMI